MAFIRPAAGSVRWMPEPGAGRQRRLAEELEEAGLVVDGSDDFRSLLLEEIEP